MQRMRWAIAAGLVVGAACATSPTGRKQLQLLPASQLNEMGVQAFQDMKKQTPISNDPVLNAEAQCVGRAIIAVIPEDLLRRAEIARDKWEVVVFEDPTPNAFALPGGKIGVHTGMFKIATTPEQLAAVMGHEISHVLAEHGNERVSQQIAVAGGLTLAQVVAATDDPEKAQKRALVLGLIGLGAQVGILLPFSRTQESEADKLGLDFMASAGFDPHQAVDLWKNMETASGGQPPEFLSTHPSHGTRIKNLTERMPRALALKEEAAKSGRHPGCTAPQAVASAE